MEGLDLVGITYQIEFDFLFCRLEEGLIWVGSEEEDLGNILRLDSGRKGKDPTTLEGTCEWRGC